MIIPYYGSRALVSTKQGFGEGVLEAAKHDERIIALGADITASVGLDLFRDLFPERFFSMGIAEQNAMGVAAGLALGGKVPVFSTYGVFAAFRAADQLRISVCYNNLHVVVGGAHAGISVGPDGATHQALEDIAFVRTLPNMTLLSPCDATQARIATMKAFAECHGPVYIRFGREAVPDFTDPGQEFIIGKAEQMTYGDDLSIVATGHMVWEALEAARMLASKGIGARVINMHTIKPIDREILVRAARETGLIITVEEHQVNGGLGSAVAEVVSEHHPVPVMRIGMHDRFGESGKPAELMAKYGLNAAHIAETAIMAGKIHAKLNIEKTKRTGDATTSA
jgi:transketolase